MESNFISDDRLSALAARLPELICPEPLSTEAILARKPTSHDSGTPQTPQRGRRWPWILAAAAVVAVVLPVTYAQLTYGPDQTAAEAVPTRTISTKRGETIEVFLSDGTRVRLAAASTLRFPSKFEGARDVRLDGEAYFEVVHDSNRPFTVHTTRAIVRDLGTSFSVRAYSGSASAEVVVAEGVVSLAAIKQVGVAPPVTDSLILTRADLGRLDANGGLTVKRGIDVEAYHAWLTGELVFTNAPLREVVPQLSRWYDLDVQLADSSLADERVTATFDTKSVSEALDLLAIAVDARIKRADRTVTLHTGRGN